MAGGIFNNGAATSAWVLLIFLLCCGLTMENTSGVSAAAAPSPSSVDCSSATLNLADCLTFLEEGSEVIEPEKSCCSGLKKVVKDNVSCLCDAFKQSASIGVSLNMTKALSLPASCGVHTPPFSNCNTAFPGAPVSSPSSGTVPAPSPVLHPSSSTMTSLALPSAALIVGVWIALCSFHL